MASRNRRFPEFAIRAGIRQGCPFSPLIFAVVVDLFLRQLARALRPGHVRAYADDTAAIVEQFARLAPAIEYLFRRFEASSGLALNLPKIVVIPLWPEPLQDVRARVASWSSFWAPWA